MGWRDLFTRKKGAPRQRPALYFYNTLGKEKQLFTLPSPAREVRMYNCGPTVYGRQHIGNLSMFVFTDLLRRTLEFNGFRVKQVINFTDVGHLSSDADEGEDKMTVGLKREGLALSLANMRVLGEKYANLFLEDIRALNAAVKEITFPRASDYIQAQIAMIKTLEEKAYTYTAKGGVYFDTSRYPEYGKLGDIDLAGLKVGARVAATAEKRNPTDFLLWKLDPHIGWESPWGLGFPGWHIECSAMIRSILGPQIDIHTGGIEHIPVHHNNEIAQSESATGKKPFARFWLHRAHLQLEGAKIAKSEGNVIYLSDIIERGFHPLSLRYLFLSAHYRSTSNFTWEALEAAQQALVRLIHSAELTTDTTEPPPEIVHAFEERINDDLDTPGALAVLWGAMKNEEISRGQKRGLAEQADRVLGLRLLDPDERMKRSIAEKFVMRVSLSATPEKVQKLIEEREAARKAKNWELADRLRRDIEEEYTIEDTPDGPLIFQRPH